MAEPGLLNLEQLQNQQQIQHEQLQEQQNINAPLENQQNILNANQQANNEIVYNEDQQSRKKTLAYRLRDFKNANYKVSDYAYLDIKDVSITKLQDEYGQQYHDKSMFKSREKKIKNKKSRLYKKDQNAKALEKYEKERWEERNDEAILRRSVPIDVKKKIKFQELKDISVLSNILSEPDMTQLPAELNKPQAEVNRMKKADKERYLKARAAKIKELKKASTKNNFNELLNNYTSIDASPADKENNALDIMTRVTQKLMSYDFVTPKLTDDAYIAKNVKVFDDMIRLLDIYHRLNEKFPNTIQKISNTVKNKLDEKVNRLEDIGNFYRIRKMIISNPYYRTHYNEELSYNAELKDSPEKKLLAKQLRASYYLGKNLQKYAFHLNDLSGGLEGYTNEHRQGKNQLATPVLNSGSNDYIKKAEGQICLLSMFKEDQANILTPQIKAYQDALSKETDEQVKQQLKDAIQAEKDQLTKTGYKKHAENILAELEREQSYLPPEEFKLDLTTVGRLPLTREKLNYGSLGSKNGNNMVHIAKNRTKKKMEVRGKLGRMIQNYNTSGAHINSKRYGNILGTDQMSRMIEIGAGIYCDYIPEDEVLEMFENLLRPQYPQYANNNDPEIADMLDDCFLEGLGTYYTTSYQMMQQVLNGVGDKFNFLSPEDLVRFMSPKMADIISGGVLATMGNSTQEGGVTKFIHIKGDKYSFLQDFWAKFNALGSAAMVSTLAAKDISYESTVDGTAKAYKQQVRPVLNEKLTAINEKLFKPGVTAGDISNYYTFFRDLSEEEADAKKKQILNPELDEDTIYKLTYEAYMIMARQGMPEGSLYVLEKCNPESLHKESFHNDDDDMVTFQKMEEGTIDALYASNEGGFEFFKELYPEEAEQYITSEEEKQAYFNTITGSRWNPAKKFGDDYKKSVNKIKKDLIKTYSQKTTKFEKDIKDAEKAYKESQNQNNVNPEIQNQA